MTYPTAVQKFVNTADVIDIKEVVSEASLRQFIAGFMEYYPWWVRVLYGVRAGFVKLLGITQKGMPVQARLRPETVPMMVGEYASFFKVKAASQNHYWVAGVSDTHLTAYLAILRDPLSDGRNHFYVMTLVKYHNWRGPLYYNVIRPFHHLVVGNMMRAGANVPIPYAEAI